MLQWCSGDRFVLVLQPLAEAPAWLTTGWYCHSAVTLVLFLLAAEASACVGRWDATAGRSRARRAAGALLADAPAWLAVSVCCYGGVVLVARLLLLAEASASGSDGLLLQGCSGGCQEAAGSSPATRSGNIVRLMDIHTSTFTLASHLQE
jgi:hypothetical protein